MKTIDIIASAFISTISFLVALILLQQGDDVAAFACLGFSVLSVMLTGIIIYDVIDPERSGS